MIYVYGDSFSCPPSHHYHHKEARQSWPKLVANHIGTKEVNHGLGGSSFAHMFQQIRESYKNWDKGDFIIICQTNLRRKLFFENLPHISNLKNLVNYRGFRLSSDQQKLIFKFCYSHFNDKLLAIEQATAFYSLINRWLIERNVHCHVLHCFRSDENILENFSNITFSFGKTLNYISEHEYKVPRHVNDDRVGHISLPNHFLISKQVFSALKNQTAVDLSVNFTEGIL
jgi:hypothetical protein